MAAVPDKVQTDHHVVVPQVYLPRLPLGRLVENPGFRLAAGVVPALTGSTAHQVGAFVLRAGSARRRPGHQAGAHQLAESLAVAESGLDDREQLLPLFLLEAAAFRRVEERGLLLDLRIAHSDGEDDDPIKQAAHLGERVQLDTAPQARKVRVAEQHGKLPAAAQEHGQAGEVFVDALHAG